MFLLNPMALWFLLACGVPWLVHWSYKRRYRVRQWAAMSFLIAMMKVSGNRQNIRHRFLLLLRIGIITAVVIALARPIFSGLMGWGGGRVEAIVVILDRSVSMESNGRAESESLRAQMLKCIQRAVAEMGDVRWVWLDSVTGKTRMIEDIAELGQSETQATDSGSAMVELIEKALEEIGKQSGRCELWIATDFQASNWSQQDGRWNGLMEKMKHMPQRPSIRFLESEAKVGSNYALQILTAQRVANELRLEIEIKALDGVEAGSEQAHELQLHAQINGAGTSEKIAWQGPGIRVKKRLQLAEGDEGGYGAFSIGVDANTRDNVSYFTYGKARPVRVSIVGEDGPVTQMLSRVLMALKAEHIESERVVTQPVAQKIRLGADLVIWAAPRPDGADQKALEDDVKTGGNVLLFPHPSVDQASFLGVTWLGKQTIGEGQFWKIHEWNRTEGALRDGQDGRPIPCQRMIAIQRQRMSGNGEVLAKWDDGEAALLKRQMERGAVYGFGTWPEDDWSNAANGEVLVPFIYRLVMDAREAKNDEPWISVGSSQHQALPLQAMERVLHDRMDAAQGVENLAGVYKVEGKWVAINRPKMEDDSRKLHTAEINELCRGVPWKKVQLRGKDQDHSLSIFSWRAFLVAVLIFMLVEAVLCLPKRRA